jgi:ATP-binding cassette subfamily B protein
MDKINVSTAKDTVKIYISHTKKYAWWVIVLVVSLICASSTELYRPILYKQFFDILAKGNLTNPADLFFIIFELLFLAILGWAFWRITVFANIYSAANIMTDLLNSCYKYLHGHSYDYFNNNFSGSLVRKVNRYSRAFEDITDQIIWNIAPTVISIIFILVVLFLRSPILAWIILIWTLIYIIFNYLFIRYKMKFDLERATIDSETTGYLADTVSNHLNIRSFSSFNSEFSGFKRITSRLCNIRIKAWSLDNYAEGVQGLLMLLLEFIIMFFAILGWKNGLLTIGDFALIQAYLIKIFDNIWGVGRFMRKIYSSLADAQEMTEVLLTKHEIIDAEDAKPLNSKVADIIFHNVSFSYQKQSNIIDSLNLSIKNGEKLALIGPSGGGKSTIAKLLMRLYDIDSGEITINQQNIKDVTQNSLRDAIAFVPQDPVLFHRSLMENIKYSKPGATEKEVIAASKLAHCHEFISKLPLKYETFVGERGVKLSGGERQRVAIARAILKNAPILLLDEATSSLDSKSEKYIQAALGELMKDRTTIVIAHRLSTIMQMDRILVIDKGKVTEEGSHKELLKAKSGTYQKLWQIQAGGFK